MSITGAEAAAGDLDPTFGAGGKVTTHFPSSDSSALGVAVESDGKIVAAGNGCACAGGPSNPQFAVARYNADGTLDTSFGSGGTVTSDFTPTTDAGAAVAIQTNGKIVVAGLSGGDFAVVRYNTDGSLDAGFGTGGRVTTDFGGSSSGQDQANAVVLQADGKIVAAGGGPIGFALARYNSDGTLDSTFGSAGKVETDVGSPGFAYELAIQTDGKIVAAGSGGSGDFALARYNADGTLDSSFGTGGKVTTDFGAGLQPAYSVALQSDGKILAAGGNADFAVARYSADGALDATFGTAGKVTTDFGSTADSVSAVLVQSDGKIVAAGHGPGDFVLARYNADGSLDGGFGNGGKVTTDLGATDNLWDAAFQSDGKIVAAGNTFGPGFMDFALARYSVGQAAVSWAAQDSVDFNGDHITDLGALYRGMSPQDSLWYAPGTFQIYFGATSDVPVPGDYDGDGKTDAVIFRPSTGLWYGPRTGAPQIVIQQIVGQAGDIPIPGDYDGDGKTDPAYYRPSTQLFFAVLSGGGTKSSTFGAAGDVPVPRDYDGDGKTDFAIYRQNATAGHLGLWYAPLSGGGVYQIYFGAPGDKPVPGDYNGDKKAEAVIFREAAGLWYGPYNGAPGVFQLNLGTTGDVPIPGYYDANLSMDPAIYRKATGLWFALLSGGGVSRIDGLGQPTDVPIQKRPTLAGGL